MKKNKKIIVLLVMVVLVSVFLYGCGETNKEPSVKEKVETALKEKKITIPIKELIKEPFDKAWIVYPTEDAKNHPEGFQDIQPSDKARIFLQKDGKALEPIEFEGVNIAYPKAISIPYLEIHEDANFIPGKDGDTPTIELQILDEC